jgi:hypothetical protein
MDSEKSLRLDYDANDECIVMEVLNPHRFANYGLGTFLDKIDTEDPSEVSISEKALEVLLKQPERRGVQGMEFFPHGCVSWGSLEHRFKVHASRINVPDESKVWIKKFCVEEVQGD